jgi:hypothetical protein
MPKPLQGNVFSEEIHTAAERRRTWYKSFLPSNTEQKSTEANPGCLKI